MKDDRVGVAGDLPPLVQCADSRFAGKAFHDGEGGGGVGPGFTR